MERLRSQMQIQLELSERMSQAIANQVRDGEFETPECLVLAAIGRYLDEKLEIAHTDALIAESDASGPAVAIDKAEFDRLFAEARILP